MIEHTLEMEDSILYVRPISALKQADFERLARTVDPYIEATGALAGLIIDAPTFPGWESLGAMSAHIRFVREHLVDSAHKWSRYCPRAGTGTLREISSTSVRGEPVEP